MTWSLERKYAVSIAFLIFLLLAMFSGIFYFQFHSILKETLLKESSTVRVDLLREYKINARNQTELLAENLINSVYFQNLLNIQYIIKPVRALSYVESFFVFNADGKMLHDGTKNLLHLKERLDPRLISAVHEQEGAFTHTEKSHINVIAPIKMGEEILGFVQIRFSLAEIEHQVKSYDKLFQTLNEKGKTQTIESLALASLLLTPVGLFLAILLARNLSQPILQLSRLTKEIGRGNYDVEFPPQRSDEIGQLRSSFKQMAVSLKETTFSKGYVDNILSRMLDTLVVTDLQGKIKSANPALCQLLGYSERELLAQSIEMILPEKEMTGLITSGKGSSLKTFLVNAQTRYQAKSGRLIPVLLSISKLPGKGVGQEGFILVAQDISKIKENEMALQKARRKADESNQAKSEFLSRMSHELRTPLNAILGFSQLMLLNSSSTLSDREKENIRLINHAGEHLLKLINKVLDLSKIESGTLEINLEPVNLIPLLKELKNLNQPIADKFEVNLIDQFSGQGEIFVLAEKLRLQQVLFNLLSNAIKYNHKGGAVTLSYESSMNGRLKIWVTDTGPGISPDQQKMLFEPFNRLDAEYSEIEGTGIGLTISKRITELMGGRIGVESSLGQGSRFFIELPVSEKPVGKQSGLSGNRQLG